MSEELKKELVELAKKHGLEIEFSCLYCQRKLHEEDMYTAYMVAFVEPIKKN